MKLRLNDRYRIQFNISIYRTDSDFNLIPEYKTPIFKNKAFDSLDNAEQLITEAIENYNRDKFNLRIVDYKTYSGSNLDITCIDYNTFEFHFFFSELYPSIVYKE